MIFYFDFDLFIHFYFFSVTSGTPRKKAYTGSVFDCEWFPKLLSNDITNKYIITKVNNKSTRQMPDHEWHTIHVQFLSSHLAKIN